MVFLFGGVCMGLSLGILPGIGGIAGTAMLLPFTYHLDPATALALLLGLAATTTTADPISAIVLGAPGHAASAATTLDGYPMTSAARAAARSAPLICRRCRRPVRRGAVGGHPAGRASVVLFIGSPELLGLAVFGISMVAALSGNTPLRGLTCACFGMMLAMIGSDPQTGTLRWTLDSLYLWEGLPLVPLALGIYALPELCDLARRPYRRRATRQNDRHEGRAAAGRQGLFPSLVAGLALLLDRLRNGSDPRHRRVGDRLDFLRPCAAHRERRSKTFGTGDVRGVIAAEAATNSREGGGLVPTVVFGVPSSAGMAILLGAF